MDIKLSLNIGPSGRIEGSQPKEVKLQTVMDAKANFTQSEVLKQSLRESPDARIDMIAKAKQVVSDLSYPSTEIIRKIASLLAQNKELQC